MDAMETGLRHRLRRAVRQIASQHEHLRSAHRAVAEAAEAGDIHALELGINRLQGAIDAHFSLEEGVFFPAIHGLHPQSESLLSALVSEHAVQRADLERLRAALGARPLAEFVADYRAFAAVTAEHEAREERLLASLAHLHDSAV